MLALIRFFSCMYTVVDFKVIVRTKGLATMLALIRLHFCVDMAM